MYSPRLKDEYQSKVKPAMQEKFGYKNGMEVPKLLKICINQGVGAAVADKKLVDAAVAEMNGHHHYTEEPPKLLWIDEVGNVPSDEELERAVKTISSQKGITIYKSHPKDICEEVR